MDDEGAGWEQQMDNERRRYEEEQAAQRAHRKAFREAWQKWVNNEQPKESSPSNAIPIFRRTKCQKSEK
jgi:hypothetical protein